MDEHMTVRAEVLPLLEPEKYEQLYRLLHAYHFGAISFLELLDAYEEILGLHQTELPDGDRRFA